MKLRAGTVTELRGAFADVVSADGETLEVFNTDSRRWTLAVGTKVTAWDGGYGWCIGQDGPPLRDKERLA